MCFTAPPPHLKQHFRMFSAQKQVCTGFTAPQRWKRRCRVLPTHKQACSSFTGLPQWRKMLSPAFQAHKQACMCFTAPPWRLKRRCRVFPAYKQVCTSCTGPPQWLKLFLHLYWHFHRPARASQTLFGGENGFLGWFPTTNTTSTVEKTAFSIFSGT